MIYYIFLIIVVMFNLNLNASYDKCSCPDSQTRTMQNIDLSIENSSIIFSGIVEDIIMIDAHNYIAKMKVNELFKNTIKENVLENQKKEESISILKKITGKIDVVSKILDQNTKKNNKTNYQYILSSTIPSECGFLFNVGWSYLIYAKKSSSGLLKNSLCDRSKPIHILPKKELETIRKKTRDAQNNDNK